VKEGAGPGCRPERREGKWGARAGLAAGPRRKREAGPRGWGVGLGAGFQGDDLPFPFFSFPKAFPNQFCK